MTSSNVDNASAAPELRKPVAVWVTQVLAMVAAVGALAAARFLAQAVQSYSRAAPDAHLIIYAIGALIVLWMGAIIVTTQRRMPVARWLGGLFITVLLCAAAIDTPGAFRRYRIGDEPALDAFGILAVGMLSGWWLYAFAFSPTVARYLRR